MLFIFILEGVKTCYPYWIIISIISKNLDENKMSLKIVDVAFFMGYV